MPPTHAYASASIPGPAVISNREHSERGDVILAPLLARGAPVGAVIIEGQRGQMFANDDLTRLQAMLARDLPRSA